MQKIGILIIDDHPTVRLGLEAILNHFEDIEVLATAEDGESGIKCCRTVNPAVVLVDIYMTGMDGIATIAMLKQELPHDPSR
ncbi:MAG: response regulator transcription factor [Anaerolineae bacterium]|nr:response regulator transcription factor [Anaerolineae bacterium]